MPIQFNVYFALAVGAESVHPHVCMLASSSQGQNVKGNDQTTFMPMDSLGHIDTHIYIYFKKNKQTYFSFYLGLFFTCSVFTSKLSAEEFSESSSYCISLLVWKNEYLQYRLGLVCPCLLLLCLYCDPQQHLNFMVCPHAEMTVLFCFLKFSGLPWHCFDFYFYFNLVQ